MIPRPLWVVTALLLASGCGGGAAHHAADAAADAARSDGGSPDGGSPDAARPDGGSPDAALPAGSRVLTFVNECPFAVWVGAAGGNASQPPCQTSAECSFGQSCDGKNCYCTADTQCGGATKCRCPSAAACPDVAKRCRCAADADCGNPLQGCNNGSCFWTLPATPTSGAWSLTAAGTAGDRATATLPAGAGRVVWSGNIGAATGCDASGRSCETGDCNGAPCPAGVGLTPPATLAEFTLLKDIQDTYDVEVIDGVNLPIMMAPTTAGAAFGALPGGTAAKDFWCGNPGAAAPSSPVAAATMDGWPAGGCSWSLAPPSLAYVKVAEAAGAAACTAHAGCAGDDVCGVSLEGIRDRHSAATQCGAFRGYWTPKIACSYGAGADALPPFNCTATEGAPYGTLYHLYMCDNGSLSCYASSDSACCGCSSWDWSGTPLPATATCTPNSDWTTLVEPTLEFFKRACPMSYTYPFDDPSSTFTCATAGTPNGAGYTITYCPGGLTGRPVK